jgi:hypothetical protein
VALAESDFPPEQLARPVARVARSASVSKAGNLLRPASPRGRAIHGMTNKLSAAKQAVRIHIENIGAIGGP